MSENKVVEILLVEDNPRDAELMIRALKKRHLVNHLTLVEDGSQALDFLLNRKGFEGSPGGTLPKIVLLDLKLPKVSGLEVLRQIKANETTRKIPVVIVTSSAEDPDIHRAYELGANSYVVKPVDFDAFSDVVSNLGLYWLLINQPSG